jgi:hypothetical protein
MPDLHFPYSGGTEVLARNPDGNIEKTPATDMMLTNLLTNTS